MLYRCVRCGEIYKDSDVIVKGCEKCHNRFFILVREDESVDETDNIIKLSKDEKQEIEDSIKNIVGEKEVDKNIVVLDLESIRVSQPGKYKIDLIKLFKNEPLVLKTADGKYFIDVARALKPKTKH
ncbi:MAG: hypothetical protein COW47_01490 [Candidatus Huberarchaeum crystalense]|uniref:Zn-ribbon containing protein n=1 Tax=Huberarchaeum crystalense TaxID=2014257 RepID=A0A2G9LIS9_HUBC1|nr:hypothetical protein [archaeon]OIP20125.1 MAG: hypothetical protein AUJ91_02045 [archaeon CG2_30_31_98]PIN66425.1 MAG: hypothetical protein COW69_02390 [Candidatus Huberarchaeum crystalense]NCS98479.1 hypothetical protein [archaeon]PIV13860.1 MAG: hypothetical protein COS45_00645 [Candidatus Huberarchaeum crystalense]